ncbi:polymer-forming cytoskeletal protein [Emcibacter sp. SYSU 3D8]|uniref:bactofilin family protein n=1 Tax=Emcibacter sp. SYSU 3D8 TaxID=3133969 RepID=UPI0031FE665D
MSTNPNRSAANTPSIIGGDVQLKGNLVTTGEVQFDGRMEGDLHCGSLTIGESAEVTGSVVAETVIIHGKLKGTIRARRVRLERTAKVQGDVWHEIISIEAGAHIEGQFVHVDNPLESAPGRPVVKQAGTPGAQPATAEAPTNGGAPARPTTPAN